MIGRLYARLGLTGLVIAALIAALVVQTVRLEGFSLWPVEIQGWRPLAIERGKTIEDIRKAQTDAADKARLARLEQEAIYREEARKADAREHAIREEAMDLAERYIAAHRVRPQAYRGPPGGTGTPGEGGSPESNNGPGGEAELDEGLVAVTAEDVRICTRNTSRLIAAREWGAGTVACHRSPPVPLAGYEHANRPINSRLQPPPDGRGLPVLLRPHEHASLHARCGEVLSEGLAG